ncbi:MAG: hypothetical protein FWC93_05915, partial [Defluviitaleaceae bacterium]|nr:hypothetical protein [Defluviitaleaceae bacterium]
MTRKTISKLSFGFKFKQLIALALIITMTLPHMMFGTTLSATESDWAIAQEAWSNLPEIEPIDFDTAWFNGQHETDWLNPLSELGSFFDVDHGFAMHFDDVAFTNNELSELPPDVLEELLRATEAHAMQDSNAREMMEFSMLLHDGHSYSDLMDENRALIFRRLDIAYEAQDITNQLFTIMEQDGFSLSESIDLIRIMSSGLFDYIEAQIIFETIHDPMERIMQTSRFERFAQRFDIVGEVNSRRLINKPFTPTNSFGEDDEVLYRAVAIEDGTGLDSAKLDGNARLSNSNSTEVDINADLDNATRRLLDISGFLNANRLYERHVFFSEAYMSNRGNTDISNEPSPELESDEQPTESTYDEQFQEYRETLGRYSESSSGYSNAYECNPEPYNQSSYPEDQYYGGCYHENQYPGTEDHYPDDSNNERQYIYPEQPILPTEPQNTNLRALPPGMGMGIGLGDGFSLENALQARHWANLDQKTPECWDEAYYIFRIFTTVDAFNEARYMFLSGHTATEIDAGFALGVALQVEPHTFMLAPGIYEPFRGTTPYIGRQDVGTDPFMLPGPVKDDYPFDIDLVMMLTDAGVYEVEQMLIYGSATMNFGFNTMSAPTPPTHDDIVVNPFGLHFNTNESVCLSTGAASFRTNVLSLPGRNGFGLNLDLVYDSGQAELRRPTVGWEDRWVDVPVIVATEYHVLVFNFTQSRVNGVWLEPDLASITPYTFSSSWARSQFMSIFVSPFYYDANSRSHWTFATSTSHIWCTESVLHPHPINTTQPNPGPHGLGAGWMFDLPYIFDGVLHIPGRGRFALNGNAFRDHTLQDMRLHDDATFISGGITSTRRLAFQNGTNYFFCAQGSILGMRDRFNNTIRFEYTNVASFGNQRLLTRIIDTNNISITLQYQISGVNRTVTVTSPDGSTYTINMSPILGHNESFRVDSVRNQVNATTSFTYDVREARFDFLSKSPNHQNHVALLTQVNYPSGARLNFTYASSTSNLGAQGSRNVWRVATRSLVDSGTEYQRTIFAYNGEPTAFPQNVATPPTNHTYSTTVTQNNGVRTAYTFNHRHLNTSQRTYSPTGVLLSAQTITYNNDRLPTRITLTEHRGYGTPNHLSRTTTQTFTYNRYGQVIEAVNP